MRAEGQRPARQKAPIIAGMLLSMTMIGCNYTKTQLFVMVLMSLAFFGKGFGALGWTVIADASPKEMVGVNGGVFNLFGNLSSITTPTIIGFLAFSLLSFAQIPEQSESSELSVASVRRALASEHELIAAHPKIQLTHQLGLHAR